MKKLNKALFTAVIVISAVLLAFSFSSFAADSTDENWVCAWGTAPTEIGVEGYNHLTAYVGSVTARVVLTPTASGKKVRIKISNAYGEDELSLTRVTIARSKGGSKIDVNSTKIITFNEGYQGFTLAPGEEIYSDPVVFPVTGNEDKIAISFYAQKFTNISTMGLSGATAYLTFGETDKTNEETFSLASVLDDDTAIDILSRLLGISFDVNLKYGYINVVPCIASLDVLPETNNGYSVVVIGDSTVSNQFPDYLAQAIKEAGVTNVGVAGKGLIGNSLLEEGIGLGKKIFGKSLLERFDADALKQSGVKYVIVKIGANDIVHPVCADSSGNQPTAQEIIAGYKQLFKKCHDAGIRVIAAGITQWKGSTFDYFGTGDAYVRSSAEFQADWKIAKAVNNWLATTTEHDGYVNFADISANPKDPDAFMPEYTTDGFHPSDELQKVWAKSFPLSLIGIGKSVNKVSLNPSAMAVYKGYTRKITATVYPSTAENKTVKWYSENPKIATVSSNGTVKGISDGYTTITCRTNDGGIIATCAVRVVTMAESVTLNRTTAAAYTTRSFTLTATVLPKDAFNKEVTWSSSNTKVATVDKNGKVTGVGAGTAIITCTTVNRGHKATCTVKVYKKTEVTGISVSSSSFALYTGYSRNVTATVSPANATYKNVRWTSANPKVAKVDANGKVTGVAAGKTTITCASADNPMIKKVIDVRVYVMVTGVTLDRTAAGIYTGYTRQLKATIIPSNASVKTVSWTSSNPKVATVSSNGTVKGIAPGYAYITCTTVNKGHTAKCLVKVVDPIKTTSVKLNRTTAAIYDGKTYQFTATVAPSDATVKSLIWTSSDTSVVTVSSTGKIYGVNPGKATITCTTKDTGKKASCVVTVVAVVPTSVTLDRSTLTVGYGAIGSIKATVLPSNATNKSLKWTSSDPKVVYVSQYGNVKGMTPGKSAVITCTTVSGNRVARCTVTVKPIAVTGVSLSASAATLNVGQRGTLKATVAPSNATNKAVTWTSSNTAVATVSSTGVVTAVGGGTALITCRTKDGGHTDICTIQVKSIKVLGVTLDKTKLTLNKGSTALLTASIMPENASNKAVTWTSSDRSVATVQNGKVTAVGKGTCEIKVYTADGNYIALCKVTVV